MLSTISLLVSVSFYISQPYDPEVKSKLAAGLTQTIGSRPSDHYFRSVCWFVCLSFVQFFSASFDPISIKLGHMLYVWV